MIKHTQDPICPSCEQKLKLAHPYLMDWFHQTKGRYPDLHISYAYRDKVDQEQAFLMGKTTKHFPDSPHNKVPSIALDIFQQDSKGVGKWDKALCAQIFDESRKDGWTLIWGGHFPSLGDADHFQFHCDT